MSKDRSPRVARPPKFSPTSRAARHRLWVAVAILSQAVSFTAMGGRRIPSSAPPPAERSPRPYLPVLGPVPLRIQSPPPARLPVALPPLAMKDSTAAPAPPSAPDSTHSSTNSLPPPDPDAGSATANNNGPGPDPSKPELGSLMLDPAYQTPPAPGIITPQMLVQFFKPVGSNMLGGAWTAPVFVPPTPPPSRPSTAVYRSN